MSIYVTGDTHGFTDIRSIDTFFASRGKNLTKNDYMIILGDVAACWDGATHDEMVLKKLNEYSATILWIDGNHENFDIINNLPESEWMGGRVHKLSDSVIHLMRGQVFIIDGRKFFTFGGGYSIDQMYRIPTRSWWEQEMPSEAEYEEGMANLEKHGNKVDYILTHTAPGFVCRKMVANMIPGEEVLQDYFTELAFKIDFKHWYFGHWHYDLTWYDDVYDKFTAMFNVIEKIEE